MKNIITGERPSPCLMLSCDYSFRDRMHTLENGVSWMWRMRVSLLILPKWAHLQRCFYMFQKITVHHIKWVLSGLIAATSLSLLHPINVNQASFSRHSQIRKKMWDEVHNTVENLAKKKKGKNSVETISHFPHNFKCTSFMLLILPSLLVKSQGKEFPQITPV